MTSVTVRYIVDSVDDSIDFYCKHLGFTEVMHPAPTFAMLARGDLRFLLSQPSGPDQPGGGGKGLPDGTQPTPGGWNRISIEVADLNQMVDKLREAGVRFRSDVITGVGGNQIVLDDPSGNPIELFEPTLPEAKQSSS